jgi:hypothetical protein
MAVQRDAIPCSAGSGPLPVHTVGDRRALRYATRGAVGSFKEPMHPGEGRVTRPTGRSRPPSDADEMIE